MTALKWLGIVWGSCLLLLVMPFVHGATSKPYDPPRRGRHALRRCPCGADFLGLCPSCEAKVPAPSGFPELDEL